MYIYIWSDYCLYSGSGHSKMDTDDLNFLDGEGSERNESSIPSIPNSSLNDSDSDEEVRK